MILINLYVSNIFGNNDKREKLINFLIKNKKSKKNIKFYGDSSLKLNFINVNDVINIIYLCIKKKFKKKKNFYTINYQKDFKLEKIISIFSKRNRNIAFKKVENYKKNNLILENDIVYKNKKFPYYKPKINLLNWLKRFHF